MRFRHELEYDASPADVHAMLSDPAFRERVCTAQDAHSADVHIEPVDTEGMNVCVDQRRPAAGIPDFARRFVGEEIQVVQRESWSGPTDALLEVVIPGKPGELQGTVTLAERAGGGTVEVVEGELKVKIPVVGGRLERLIADLLTEALGAEQRVGRAWLAGDR